MAILYKAKESGFSHLGLGPLNDAVSILVTEERNGIFELTMEYPVSGQLFSELKNDRLIKADAGHELKDQRFKIIRITKPLKGIVTVYAEHVSYLTQDLALKPQVIFSGSAEQALLTWKGNLVDDNPFIVSSDITTTGSGVWTIDEVENPRRALGGVKGSILDVYGGEYRFDNYQIRLMRQRGVNSATLIAYGRNLVDLTQEEEIANTYTSIYPYSVYADDDGNSQLVTLPEYYIDSDYVDNFARRKILPVDFSSDEIETVSSLRSAAQSYIKANNVGVPKVNLKIEYVDLSKTLDYKNQAVLEEVNLCDNVPVYFEKFGINTTAKVIKIVWDDLRGHYDSVEIGEARSSLSQSINATVDGKLEKVEKQINNVMLQADGMKLIYRQSEEPPPGSHVGDLWYQPNGIYEIMYQWDGAMWKEVINTQDLDVVKRDVDQALDDAQTAKNQANEAVGKAELATSNANESIKQAQTAFDKAQESLVESASAKSTASGASALASNASILASTARDNAQAALTRSQTALDDIDGLQTYVTTEVETINNELSHKVSQTAFNSLSGTVESHSTSISQNATAITRKADSEYVDTIKGTVDSHSLLITETARGLDLKADQTVVNTINDTVIAHTLEIQAHAKELSSKMTTVDADAKYATQSALQQTSQSLSSDIVAVQGAIDDIEIGGRNLLISSTLDRLAENFTHNTTRHLKARINYYFNFITELEPNTEYVVSNKNIIHDGSGAEDENTLRLVIFNESTSAQKQSIGTLHSGSSISFKTNSNITQTDKLLFYPTSNTQINFEVFELKLEKGNKATDWTPAPEDIDHEFSSIKQTVSDVTVRLGDSEGNITALQTTATGFASRIKDAEGNINTLSSTAKGLQSRVADAEGNISSLTQLTTGLRTDVNSKASTSSVTQLANLVDTKVTTSQVNNLINTDKNIKDTRTANSPPSWYFTNYPSQRIREFKNTSTMGISGEGTYGVLETEVPWTGSSGGLVKQTFYTDHATHERRGNGTSAWQAWKKIADVDYVEGRITVLNNAINLRVTKADLINQINIDTTGILISGKKLILDGDTTVTGTFRVSNANITSVDAGKMTTGTLDAGQVNIINLNASNIASGTINTANIMIRGGSATDYTMIDGSYLESRGRFTRTWRGVKKTHDIKLRFQNGYLRARNDTEDHSLYISDMGISTYADGGTVQDASGTLAFRDTYYSNALGVTLQSQQGVVALQSENHRIVLDAATTVNIESKTSSVYLRPMRDSRVGNNEFRFWIKDGSNVANTDGVLSYGSMAAGQASGLRFDKELEGLPMIYATDGSGNRFTGAFNSDWYYGRRLINRLNEGYIYIGSNEGLRVTSRGTNEGSGMSFRNVEADQIWANALRTNPGVTGTHLYLGVSATEGGEVRVTTLNMAGGSSVNYMPLRASSINSVGSGGFYTNSAGRFYNSGDGITYVQGNTEVRATKYLSSAYVPVRASSFPTGSSEIYKSNIVKFEENALGIIRNSVIYEYDKEGVPNRELGFIIEREFPEVIKHDDISVNGYSHSSLNTKAIQELDLKVDLTREELILKIAQLEQRINYMGVA